MPAICVQTTVSRHSSIVSEFRSFLKLASSLVAGIFLPSTYSTLFIVPSDR